MVKFVIFYISTLFTVGRRVHFNDTTAALPAAITSTSASAQYPQQIPSTTNTYMPMSTNAMVNGATNMMYSNTNSILDSGYGASISSPYYTSDTSNSIASSPSNPSNPGSPHEFVDVNGTIYMTGESDQELIDLNTIISMIDDTGKAMNVNVDELANLDIVEMQQISLNSDMYNRPPCIKPRPEIEEDRASGLLLLYTIITPLCSLVFTCEGIL